MNWQKKMLHDIKEGDVFQLDDRVYEAISFSKKNLTVYELIPFQRNEKQHCDDWNQCDHIVIDAVEYHREDTMDKEDGYEYFTLLEKQNRHRKEVNVLPKEIAKNHWFDYYPD